MNPRAHTRPAPDPTKQARSTGNLLHGYRHLLHDYGNMLPATDTCSRLRTHAPGYGHMLPATDTCSTATDTCSTATDTCSTATDTCSRLRTHAPPLRTPAPPLRTHALRPRTHAPQPRTPARDRRRSPHSSARPAAPPTRRVRRSSCPPNCEERVSFDRHLSNEYLIPGRSPQSPTGTPATDTCPPPETPAGDTGSHRKTQGPTPATPKNTGLKTQGTRLKTQGQDTGHSAKDTGPDSAAPKNTGPDISLPRFPGQQSGGIRTAGGHSDSRPPGAPPLRRVRKSGCLPTA